MSAPIEGDNLDTFPKVLAYNAQHWPDDVAMREKEYGIWQEFNWQDYHNRVKWITLGLQSLGFDKHSIIGLLGDNRPEWVWGEVAAHALSARSLGIYQDSLHEEVSWLVNFASVDAIIAEDEEQCDKLLELGDDIPSVKYIIYTDSRGMRKYDDPRLIDIEELYKLGQKVEQEQPDCYPNMVSATRGEDVSILCTTSGTTSRPKLAMLHSGSFLEHCRVYIRADKKLPGDNYVSVLPLPWIVEQVYVLGQSLLSRQVVNFVETQETMMADLREIGPAFVLLAPRVWENIAAEVRSRMMDSTPLKQKLFNWGMKLGRKALNDGKKSIIAEWLLMRALRDRIGFSNLRSAGTGGAAMGPETFRFFHAIGVPLRQIYGQTEMCGAYTIHQSGEIDYDSVGTAFDSCEVKIINSDENGVGEILSKTIGMFSGYLNNDKAYNEDVRDGWMHTGDAGYFKDTGHLVVLDRMKDLAETSEGSRYSPQFIENKLKFSPYVGEAVILGRDRPSLTAIICIRYSIMSKWAEQKGIAFTSYTSLAAHPEVYEMIRREVDEVNTTLTGGSSHYSFSTAV